MGNEYTCSTCSGSGSVQDGTDERGRPKHKTCPNCDGDGYIS